MDKSWMKIKNRTNPAYIQGVDAFLEWSFSQPGVADEIRCPCRGCRNTEWKKRSMVRADLFRKGIWESYEIWDSHGEVRVDLQSPIHSGEDEGEEDSDRDDDMIEMINDAFGDYNPEGMDGGGAHSDPPNEEARKFFELLEDAQTDLYPGCSKVSKLAFIIRLLHLKCLNHWSNRSMDALLSLFKEVLPDEAHVPTSYYAARKFIRDLGLDYTNIDACENDCIIYWGQHVNAESCPKCHLPRWKTNGPRGKKVPRKVLRHFPMKKRLQRLYMAHNTAEKMRWHKERRMDDGVLRHPSDSIAWKSFDEQHPNFSSDPRNVRLGLASDGFQPYGNMTSQHSIWPVVLVPYNLPPWECMKQPYFMMTLLIPGPKSPGNEIDVYMQPMIAELKELWEEGVETYDAYSKSNFMLHAAILWTINDFPAYGNLSGWSTKGKLACPCCHKDTHSVSLRNKLCYMGHRRFLPTNHAWRRNRRDFDGKVENGVAPNPLTGEEALRQMEALSEVSLGKGQKRKRHHNHNDHNWKKKSIFFQLPYWKTLLIRHNLDVMHIERNVSDNIVSTVMGVVGKTKDTVKSRYDLVDLGIRQSLHPIEDGNRILLPAACYTLSPQEKLHVCNFLANMKVPDAFSSNISRCVNVRERKIYGLKCHDHHVLLEDIFPIAIRGLLLKEVSEPIMEMGLFFKNLCSKSLTVENLDSLEKQVVLTLCKMETVFPPAFFDVMIHLPVHLAREAKLGGPVQYRWMYPVERYLRTLKTYVRNKARPEGSIAEGYIADECLTFCSRYLKKIPTKFNRLPRNDDGREVHAEMAIFSKCGQARGACNAITLSDKEYKQACMYVLQNCEHVWPFMEEHKQELDTHATMVKDFQEWFRERVLRLLAQGQVSDDLLSIGCGPENMAHRYSIFMVNGFRFHTRERASRRRTQNSGVVVRGDDSDPNKEYYGVLEDIYELSYLGNKKVFLFKCHWWDLAHLGRGYKVDKYGITSVNTRCSLNTDEPFVLASQAEQVFYLNDNVDQDWLVVVKTNPRDLFLVSEREVGEEVDAHEEQPEDEAYQQDGAAMGAMSNDDVGIDIVVCLQRYDVEPERIVQAPEPPRTSGHQTLDAGDDFIDDNDDYVSACEDEEDLLDDDDAIDTDDSA